MLDAITHEKLKTFASTTDIAKSEIIRVLIEKAPLKIKARDRKDIFVDSLKGNKNTIRHLIYLSDKVSDKLKKMRMNNDVSNGEIIRQLISTADLNALTFKTKGENILNARAKNKKVK
jgi:hypothetical protein